MNQKIYVFLFLVVFVFVPIASANACEIAQIAIVPGSWASDETKISLTVQTQDESGAECPVPGDLQKAPTPLRISFESSTDGVFTNKDGDDPIRRINRGNTNHHFYYHSQTLASDIITARAGFGPSSLDFVVRWETVVNLVDIGPTKPVVTETESSSKNPVVISTHSEQIELSQSVKIPALEVSAGRNRLVLVGVPLEFEAEVTKGEFVNRGDFEWTFGDGTAGRGRSVKQTYHHPGEYVVVLNVFDGNRKAVSRTRVTVVPIEISLEMNNGVFNLINKGDYEVNVGGFALVGSGRYVLPKDTIIEPGRRIVLSNQVVGFAPDSEVDFVSPANKSVFKADEISGESTNNPALLEELAMALAKLDDLQRQLVVLESQRLVASNVTPNQVIIKELEQEESLENIAQENTPETILVIQKEETWLNRLSSWPARNLSLLRGIRER